MRTQREYTRTNGVETTLHKMKHGTSLPMGEPKLSLLDRIDKLMGMTPPNMRRGVFWHNMLLLRQQQEELDAEITRQLQAAMQ